MEYQGQVRIININKIQINLNIKLNDIIYC